MEPNCSMKKSTCLLVNNNEGLKRKVLTPHAPVLIPANMNVSTQVH